MCHFRINSFIVIRCCNGDNIVSILTSKMFGSGVASKRHMGFWCLGIMKEAQKWCADTLVLPRVDAAIANERGVGTHKDFPSVLSIILSNLVHLSAARSFLRTYNFSHPIHCLSTTFFPSITDAQLADCRYNALPKT